MCTFTVKNTNGIPTHAKSRIVVLRNFDPRPWPKSDCFSPVVTLPMVYRLVAMAVHNKRMLKQGDCKFAFIQATLPPEELTIVKPPHGCPFSGVHSYWKLKKISVWFTSCASSLVQTLLRSSSIPRNWINAYGTQTLYLSQDHYTGQPPYLPCNVCR